MTNSIKVFRAIHNAFGKI